VVAEIGEEFTTPLAFVLHGMSGIAVWLAAAGFALAWYIYLRNPALAEQAKIRFALIYRILDQKYFFDRFNEVVFAGGARLIGSLLWRIADSMIIDGLIVNGSAYLVGRGALVLRRVQTGYLNHYAFAMVAGLILLLGWAILG